MVAYRTKKDHRKPIIRREVYTTGEVAQIAKVAPRTVGKWLEAGHLRGYRLPPVESKTGGDRRFPHAELMRFLKEFNLEIPPALRGNSTVLLIGGIRSLADQLHEAAGTGGWEIHEGGLVRAGEIVASTPLTAAVIDTAGLGRRAALDAAVELRAACERCHAEQFPVVFVLSEDETSENEFAQVGTTFCRPFHPQQLIRHLEALIEAAR